MLTKLKKCKTLKEIYEVLGENFFEKTAMYIVMGWCFIADTINLLSYKMDGDG